MALHLPSLKQSAVYLFLMAGVWFGLAGNYIRLQQNLYYMNDAAGHIAYTQYIIENHQLPLPYTGLETYHPPLFYLIASQLHPLAADHLLYVRWFSLLLGLVFLCSLWKLLRMAGIQRAVILLLSLYLMSTPMFLIVFTSYNSDTLMLAAAGVSIVLAFSLYQKWSDYQAIALLAVVVVGLYSKFSMLGVLVSLSLTLAYLFWAAPSKRAVIGKIIGIFFLGFLFLTPWLYGHNYQNTGKWYPNNYEQQRDLAKPLRFILKPTGITNNEWSVPFVVNGQLRSIKPDLMGALLSCSLFGDFYYLEEKVATPAWLTLWIQVALLIIALGLTLKNTWTRLGKLLCLTALLASAAFVYQAKILPAASFRYIAWSWLPWALLLAFALQKEFTRFRWPRPTSLPWVGILLGLGSLVHLYFLYLFLCTA